MKKCKYVVFMIVLFVLGIGVSHAASLNVSANKRTITVGSTVTITVNATGASGWEYCLNYDSDIFTLTKSTTDTGGACVRTGSTLTGYAKVTYTLKAIRSGNSVVSIRDVAMYNDAGELINSSKGSVSLTTKSQSEIEASYSKDADLKSLSISGYELNPTFNKDVLEYSLEVENDVEKIFIEATKSDSKAGLSGIGEKELTEGNNKFNIVVTAEKGNKKTYIINVNRKELNPITVEVDGLSYNVVRKSEVLEAPTYYNATTTIINDTEVPAFVSETTGYTLVGLKDQAGTIALYIYNQDNNTYALYRQLATEGLTFVPLHSSELVEGYENKKNIKINEIDVLAYDNGNDSAFVLIYGMNVSNGEKNWYKYDTVEGTFQRYEEENINVKVGKKDSYFYLTILFAIGLGFSILIILILFVMLSKKDKKNKKLITFIENRMGVQKKEKGKDKKELEENNPLDEQFLDFIESDKNSKNQTHRGRIEKLEENKKKEEEEVLKREEKLSKREQKKLEKEQKAKEEAELAEMRDDFLSTRSNEILGDTDIIEEINEKTEEEKKSRGRKRK